MDERRVLIYPPNRRDGEATRLLLERAALASAVCLDAKDLAREMERGAAALVLTDAALSNPDIDCILRALASQPPWSDLPVVLLCPAGGHAENVARAMSAFTNVTLLERPASARTLLSAVQAALRARMRQYETRQQLAALKSAEESLRAREAQLRDADRRKDEFLAMLAHELRNPLAPVRTVGELLGRGAAGHPQLQAMADILKRQITHLTRLVDDLLDVSRITQGRIELQRETVDLGAVVDDARESVQPLIAERRHSLRLLVTPQAVYVNGDKARLVQCVSNLLTNAAKYTDAGGVIEIAVSAEGQQASIAVTDNGVGISPELLPQIFNLFVQSTRSLDRSQGGLGIGLSLVRRLIEMHDGQVIASSAGPGQGARFEIHLPLVAAPAERNAQPGAPQATATRILVVDDNRDAADSLVLILNSIGHAAQAVYSSAEALRSLDNSVPEVILLDIGLPVMDGYELAALIRAKNIPTRIVALTGYGQPEDVSKAAAAGVDAHLVKPVDLDVLEAALTARRTRSADNVVSFGRRQA
ncbi:MAG TPA: ATP-binding protein [Steroidobacteraceae bacterium]|nr:ATP-binding protein [Steroidobacteraceae bacterium]